MVLFDHHAPGTGGPSHPSPSFPLPQECWDGNDHVVYSVARRTDSVGVCVSLVTKMVEPTKDDSRPDHAAGADSVTQKAHATWEHPSPARLMGETRVVRWRMSQPLDGLLTVPPETVPSRRTS